MQNSVHDIDIPNTTSKAHSKKVVKRQAEQLNASHQQQIYRQTDRMFAVLMTIQWLAGIAAALIISPQTWIGQTSQTHVHVWAAILLGGVISFFPIWLAIFRPGHFSTRCTIAVGQMLMSSLLIHLTGGRIETHFHVFGSLAFLAFYRDWRVLVPATVVVALDHMLRGIFYPQSVFGVLTQENWRWVEHAAWVAFEDVILIFSCVRGQKEMRQIAENTAKLDASEARHRIVNESASDAILTIDETGTILFVNQAVEKIFGYKTEELVGEKIVKLMPEKMRPMHEAGISRYLQTGRRNIPWQAVEVPALHKDGHEFLIEISFGEHQDGGGRIFTAVLRDITERKRAEESLKKSEESYRDLFENANDLIYTHDLNGKFTSLNRAGEVITGYSREDASQLDVSHIVAPEFLEKARRMIADKVAGGIPTSYELEIINKAGERVLLELSTRLIFQDGAPVGVQGIGRDITERKRSQEALRKSEEYSNLFKHAGDAIIIFEPENETVLNVNDFACKIYGFPREEFVGLSLKDISENVERGEKFLAELKRQETIESFESIHYRKDQTPMNVLINSSTIEFEGKPAILSINRDVTARVKAAAALRESEFKHRTLVENMSEGLVHLDRHQRIIFVNQRFCAMTGYRQEELLGQNAAQLLLDEEGRKIVENADQRRQGTTGNFEVQLRTARGKTIWSLVGVVPTFDADGEIVGSMSVHTDITERKRAEEKLLHNALHDSLTGLPNRALFLEHLRRVIGRSMRREKTFAVLFLDFDGFKLINDSLGHLEGDRLLKMIARRLETLLRGDDVVARLGGDEFTILLDELTDSKDAFFVADRIKEVLKEPFQLGGREIFIGASIGIVMRDEKYQSPDEMLRDADIAMYRAKAGGKGRHAVFNKEMHEHLSNRLSLETELRLALDRGEFKVFYQSIMEIADNRLIGFEALVRWFHPERGQILPGEFIPVVEETGLIVPLGEWILHESCRQMREWQRRFPTHRDLHISVNLSCKQFLQQDLAQRVGEILDETGLEARFLRLEITESHIMENSEMAITIMNRLRDIGVQMSIDDFGTGYSSLSYLQRLPINFLKIDRSFINMMNSNHQNGEIVRAIVMLAKNLNMEVIAEGIESEDQAERLIELDCPFGQGYLYSKPTDAHQAEEILANLPPLVLPDPGKLNFDSSFEYN